MARKKETFYFNAYDKEGNLLCENMTSAEIAAELEIPQNRIYISSRRDSLIHGKYRITRQNPELPGKDSIWTEKEIKMWNEAVAPFLKVKWVKEYEYGVKILKGAKS